MTRPPWLDWEIADYAAMICLPQLRWLREAAYTALDRYSDQWIGEEADATRDQIWEEAGSRMGEYGDMADAVDEAMSAGYARYSALKLARQALINLFAVALAHQVEQQMILVSALPHRFRSQLDKPLGRRTFFEIAESLGVPNNAIIDDRIEELHLLANAVKHGEGPSATKLRSRRPDLFVSDEPTIDAFMIEHHSGLDAAMPLGGVGIYVRKEDLAAYFGAAEDLWSRFINAIGNRS